MIRRFGTCGAVVSPDMASHSAEFGYAVTNLKKEGLAMTPLLSLRGTEIPRLRLGTGSAISAEGRGNICIDIVAGFIPAL